MDIVVLVGGKIEEAVCLTDWLTDFTCTTAAAAEIAGGLAALLCSALGWLTDWLTDLLVAEEEAVNGSCVGRAKLSVEICPWSR